MRRGDVTEPRRWVGDLVDRARATGAWPVAYGTPAWCRLEPTDPCFVAAVAVAAECWRRGGVDLAADLRAELAAAHAAEDAEAAAAFADAARRVRRMAGRPLAVTAAERIAEANRPRAGDYPGAP